MITQLYYLTKKGHLFIFLLFLSGCYSSNVLQTGRVLEKGEYEITGAVGVVRYFDAAVRIGFGGNTDVGLAISPDAYGHYKVDVKYQLLKIKPIEGYLSLSLGAEYFNPQYPSADSPLHGPTLATFFSANHGGNWVYYISKGIHSKVTDFNALTFASEIDFSDTERSYFYSFISRGGIGIRRLIGVDNYLFFETSFKNRFNYRAYTLENEVNGKYPVYYRRTNNFTPSFAVGIVFTNVNKKKREKNNDLN
jgi:hypothetical protein